MPDVRRAEEQGLTGERLTTSGPILVVDDDEALRALLAATLASGGYCVLEAATGIHEPGTHWWPPWTGCQ